MNVGTTYNGFPNCTARAYSKPKHSILLKTHIAKLQRKSIDNKLKFNVVCQSGVAVTDMADRHTHAQNTFEANLVVRQIG